MHPITTIGVREFARSFFFFAEWVQYDTWDKVGARAYETQSVHEGVYETRDMAQGHLLESIAHSRKADATVHDRAVALTRPDIDCTKPSRSVPCRLLDGWILRISEKVNTRTIYRQSPSKIPKTHAFSISCERVNFGSNPLEA